MGGNREYRECILIRERDIVQSTKSGPESTASRGDQRGDLLDGYFVQRGRNQIGPGRAQLVGRMMADERDCDTSHPAGLRRFHASDRVLEHDAPLRFEAQLCCGCEEYFRVGLAALHIIPNHHRSEVPAGVGDTEQEVEVAWWCRRSHCLGPSCFRERGQKPSRAWQQLHAFLANRRSVQVFFPLAQFGALLVISVGEEQLADNVRVAHSEGGGEVVARKRLANLSGKSRPSSEVLLCRIDQGAIDIPDDRGSVRRSLDCFWINRRTWCRGIAAGLDEHQFAVHTGDADRLRLVRSFGS